MNPLNRRMFRDPRAARRATGILASSAPLMTSAQKAMAQGEPMRAQTGAMVNYIPGNQPVFDPTKRRAPYAGFTKPLPAGQQAKLDNAEPFFRVGAITPANLLTDFGSLPPTQEQIEARLRLAEMEKRRSNTIEAVRQKAEADSMRAIGYRQPADMDPEGVIAGEYDILRDLANTTKVGIGALPYGRTAEDDPSNSGSVPLSTAERARLNALRELRGTEAAPGVETSDAPETVAPTSAELLAQAQQGTEAARDAITATKPKAANIDPEGVVAGESALAAQEATSAERRADRSPGRGVTSTAEQAKANDELLGIEDIKSDGDPLTRKERVEQRYQLLKDLLGEDKAKDIRTDKNYNLMMLGLRIAAGQSEDALSNIAAGAGQQLQEFGEVSGEISQQEAQDERAIKLQAANEVGAEMAAEAERKYQTGRAEDEQAFRTSERLGGEQAAIALADVNNAARVAMQSTQLSWQAAEKALDREAAELLANSEQQFRLALTNINQTFQGEQNALNREEAYNRLVMTHDFQAREAAKGRIHDLDKLIAAQEHAMEMGLSDQAFRISLANFTAGIPGETQKLYEKYLQPDQIAELIVSKVTGDTKLLQGYSEARFIQDALKDQNRRDAATDEIIAKFKKENPGMEVPNIGEKELSAFFADVYKQAGFGKND